MDEIWVLSNFMSKNTVLELLFGFKSDQTLELHDIQLVLPHKYLKCQQVNP